MANTVTTRTVFSGSRGTTIRHMVVVTAATDETDAVVIDASAFTLSRGQTVDHVKIRRIHGWMDGNFIITLEFDATTDDRLIKFTNQVAEHSLIAVDFREAPGGGLEDPQSAGTTGDVVLTTSGAQIGDEYQLIIDWEGTEA